jgi:hypothetical protein
MLFPQLQRLATTLVQLALARTLFLRPSKSYADLQALIAKLTATNIPRKTRQVLVTCPFAANMPIRRFAAGFSSADYALFGTSET